MLKLSIVLIPRSLVLEQCPLSNSQHQCYEKDSRHEPMACPMTILLKLLVLLLLKAGYYPEQSIEIIEPAKFVKASIKTGGESMLNKADSLSAGGGNTFRLLKALYDNSLIQEIRKRVLEVKTTGLRPTLNGRISHISFCSNKSNLILHLYF